MYKFSGCCPVCGGGSFSENKVLWPELVNSWQLSKTEHDYIDRQQGFYCNKCFNNLRAMGLSAAILREYNFKGTLNQFAEHRKDLVVLEINTAGNLTNFLQKFPLHRLIEYPKFDMQDLSIKSESIDLIVHSDTLEHIPNPVRALSECCRVLRSNGYCIFTIPIVHNRLSRSRVGLSPSYHGQPGVNALDQLVHTEFGADAWKFVIKSGFASCEFFAFEYPASLVLIAKK